VIHATDERVTTIAFSPDNKTLASGAGFTDSDIRLWDANTGKPKGVLGGHIGWVASLAFWPDGKKLVSASADQTMKIWDLATQKCVSTLRGHRQEVWSVALLPDNRTLVSGAKDGAIAVWDSARVNAPAAYASCSLPYDMWNFGPDHASIIGFDGINVVEWSAPLYSQPKVLFKPQFRVPIGAPYARISDDGRWFAATLYLYSRLIPARYIQVWDIQSGTQDHEVELAVGAIPLAVFDHGSKIMLYQGNQKLALLNAPDTAPKVIADWPYRFNAAGGVSMAMSADDSRFAISDWLGHAAIVSLNDLKGRALSTGIKETGGIGLSPDGTILAIPSGLGSVHLVDTQTLKETGELSGFLRGAHSAAFSPDGQRLAAGSNGKEAVTVWDVESAQRLISLEAPGSTYTHVGFSPDGSTIAAFDGGDVLRVWHAPSWDEIAVEENPSIQSP
jgi:WD40 repeat protein